MSRKRGREAIQERLRAWEEELATNRFGCARLAAQAVTDLKAALAAYDAPPAAAPRTDDE